jgi:hypothetical protein
MSFEEVASFTEMGRKKKTTQEVKDFLVDTADYAYKNRTVRLIYSHMYDLYDYPEYSQYRHSLTAFLDRVENLQQGGKLHVKSMSHFAQFLLRLLKTKYAFTLKQDGLEVNLYNPDGLEGITIAIPKEHYKRPLIEEGDIGEDADYYYITIRERVNESYLYIAL